MAVVALDAAEQEDARMAQPLYPLCDGSRHSRQGRKQSFASNAKGQLMEIRDRAGNALDMLTTGRLVGRRAEYTTVATPAPADTAPRS